MVPGGRRHRTGADARNRIPPGHRPNRAQRILCASTSEPSSNPRRTPLPQRVARSDASSVGGAHLAGERGVLLVVGSPVATRACRSDVGAVPDQVLAERAGSGVGHPGRGEDADVRFRDERATVLAGWQASEQRWACNLTVSLVAGPGESTVEVMPPRVQRPGPSCRPARSTPAQSWSVSTG